jgi:hypothetical protein
MAMESAGVERKTCLRLERENDLRERTLAVLESHRRIQRRRPNCEGREANYEMIVLNFIKLIAIIAFICGIFSVFIGAWYMLTSGNVLSPPIPTRREMVERIPSGVRRAQNIFLAVFISCILVGLIIKFWAGKLN